MRSFRVECFQLVLVLAQQQVLCCYWRRGRCNVSLADANSISEDAAAGAAAAAAVSSDFVSHHRSGIDVEGFSPPD